LNFEKLKQWQEFAQRAGSGDFWASVFGDQRAQEALKEISKSFFSEETVFPRTDIYMDPNEIIVLMEVPGCRKEDLQVTIVSDRLTVSGTINQPHPSQTLVSRERYHGPFKRVIDLPEVPGREEARGRLDNGVLELRLPRSDQYHSQKIRIE